MPHRHILHCDMDCFYAAVEMRDDPDLRGKPVIVGGDPDGRGVVAAASYEAREFGVHSAMPAARARRLCPEGIFLRPDFRRYRQESRAVFGILRQTTPLVQPLSIDEAYLDVTGRLGADGSATEVARRLRRRVHEERRLTMSVGVAPNKLVAKIASDRDKPDGLTVVPPSRVETFLAPLSVRVLHGVGPATARRLSELGVRTVAELRALSETELGDRFGRFGATLYRFARGVDDRPVVVERQRKSLSSERTFGTDLTDGARIEAELDRLAAEIAEGLQRRDLSARTVTVKVRYDDFTTVTRSRSLEVYCRDAESIARHARDLAARTDAGRRPVRLLGVGASNLLDGAPLQLALPLEEFSVG